MKSFRTDNFISGSFVLCAFLIGALVCSGFFAALSPAYGDSGEEAGADGASIVESLVTEAARGAEYDGYIVKLHDDRGVDESRMEDVAEEVVAEDVAVVADPLDVLDFAQPEAIEYIEPNYRITSFAFPDDEPRDWVYTHPLNYQWGIKYVGAQSAWRSGYDGSGVNVAILDSGAVYEHEDFDPSKIVDSYDFINDRTEAKDDFMHGSLVTGVLSAETDNVGPDSAGIGMAGLMPDAGLLVYKALDKDGNGDFADILKAYDRILNSGKRVDVINMSFGHPGFLRTEYDMLRKLMSRGTIVVTAAGNNGNDIGKNRNSLYYPAGYDGVIGVGSVGARGIVSSFSTKNASVDVVAPGENIAGLSHDKMSGHDAYHSSSGTSFAAPIVVAAAVMAKQRDAEFTAAGFLEALRYTSNDAGDDGYDTAYGYGILSLSALTAYLDDSSLNVNAPFEPTAPEPAEPAEPAGPAEPEPDAPPSAEAPVAPPETTPVAPPPAETPVASPVTTPVASPEATTRPGDAGSGATNDAASVVRKPAEKHKVKFAVNGGRRLSAGARSKVVTNGKKYGKLPTPKRKGYAFKGWHTKRKGGVRIGSATVVKLRSAQTLYARWKRK
jgi:uncharacterized repeat protein (TIGR02543 family)